LFIHIYLSFFASDSNNRPRKFATDSTQQEREQKTFL